MGCWSGNLGRDTGTPDRVSVKARQKCDPPSGRAATASAVADPSAPATVRIEALGRIVADGAVAVGRASWTWSAADAAPGVYVVRLTATTAGGAAEVRTQRVTVAR